MLNESDTSLCPHVMRARFSIASGKILITLASSSVHCACARSLHLPPESKVAEMRTLEMSLQSFAEDASERKVVDRNSPFQGCMQVDD